MTATITLVEGGGTSVWCLTFQVCSTTPSLLCVRVFMHKSLCCSWLLQCTLWNHLAYPQRTHASCSAVTFDSLWSETAHQFAYYVLKNHPRIPKSRRENPPKRQRLEIDSCYCAVPSAAFAREQKRVNILWCVVPVAQPLLHSQSEIASARSLCTQWRQTLNINMAPY